MKIQERIHWVGSGAVGLSAKGDCHTYLIDGGNELALIDCGVQSNPSAILENVKNDGFDLSKLKYCFLTHAHYDHAGGLEWLRQSGVKAIGGKISDDVLRAGPVDYYNLTDGFLTNPNWLKMNRSQIDIILDDGQEFTVGDVKIRAIHTPGHSPDSVCYLAQMPGGRKELFSGDTVFYRGFISLLSTPLNDLQNYSKGLRKLDGLAVDGLYPGHLLWVINDAQQYIDTANAAFKSGKLPKPKPFS